MSTTNSISVYYLLSEQGRKAALLQGLPETEVQRLQAPVIPEVLALCQVSPDGSAAAFVGYVPRDGARDPSPGGLLGRSSCGVILGWRLSDQGRRCPAPERSR